MKDNPAWGHADRRHDMNHFMARLIFCFFAEDTDIFVGKGRFTDTVAQMSAKDAANTHEVIGTLFRAMNTRAQDRAKANIPRWAEDFPYVNGQLFSGNDDVPRFSRIARSYLVHVGGLDWIKINPDIQLTVRHWNTGAFLTPAEKTIPVWRFDPDGLCEPITVRLVMEKSYAQDTYHPLTATIADSELEAN